MEHIGITFKLHRIHSSLIAKLNQFNIAKLAEVIFSFWINLYPVQIKQLLSNLLALQKLDYQLFIELQHFEFAIYLLYPKLFSPLHLRHL